MELADDFNKWWQDRAHWELSRQFDMPNNPNDNEYLHRLCSVAIETFRLLSLFIKPVLPELAKNAESFLGLDVPLEFSHVETHLKNGHQIGKFEHLMGRVDLEQIKKLIEASKESLRPSTPAPLPKGEGRTHPSPSGRRAGDEGSPSRKLPLPEELLEFVRKLRKEQR